MPRRLLNPLPTDHPFFVGLQAHPEFCTRPLNPSPPFLGLVSAACGKPVLDAQIASQRTTYVPPHPAGAMVSEAELKRVAEAAIEVHAIMTPAADPESVHMGVVQEVNADRA